MTWAEYIRDDLKARIASGSDVPKKLTLGSLAEQYEVSLMPVRRAVEELIREGYLHRTNGRTLEINPARLRAGRSPRAARRASPPKNHYDQIARDLAVLSATGRPMLLREQETAEHYGVSRTAVRQIFNRLAGNGMLTHLPRRGWKVRRFREKDLDDYTRVRELLELEAMSRAWPHLVDADLEHIRHGNRLPAKASDKPKIDNSLHAYLIDKADNVYIRDYFNRHGRYYSILFTWEGYDRVAAIDTVHQHHAVLDALLARDRRAAKTALKTHIRYSHPVLKAAGGMKEPPSWVEVIEKPG